VAIYGIITASAVRQITPTFVEWAQKDVSPIAWVIALNLKRRHLSPGQRATIALEATPLLAAEAKKRQQKHGGTAPGKVKNTSLKNKLCDSSHPQVSK
jgi:hypothetical protein